MVNVAARCESSLPFKEIPRRRIASTQHGPAGGDTVENKEWQPQAVGVLSAVPFLVGKEQLVASCHAVGCAVEDDVPHRKRPGVWKLPRIPCCYQQSPGPTRNARSGPPRDQQ